MRSSVHRPATDADFDALSGALAPGMDPPILARFRAHLLRGPDATWVVRNDGVPLVVGGVVDTCATADDVADFHPFAGTPERLDVDTVHALLAMAEQITREGPRQHLEVTLTEGLADWAPTLRERGYSLAYTHCRMRRAAAPSTPVPAPPGLRWAEIDETTVGDYHRVAVAAFSTVPGAAVPSLAEVTRFALAHRPRMQLLLADRVVGWCRVDEDEAGPEVASIGRDPAWRGPRLGDALLTRALELIGPRACSLTVVAENARARQLYERHGFELDAELPVLRLRDVRARLAR